MSTMPQMTAQEITDIILKAVPQSKSDTITVRITPDTIEFTVQLPLDEKTDARIKTLVERMEPYLQQKREARAGFKESRPQLPKAEGWDALPWRNNPYGQYIFADEPRAKPLSSLIFAAPGGKFESGEWIYSVSKSKRDGREFINRAKKANQK